MNLRNRITYASILVLAFGLLSLPAGATSDPGAHCAAAKMRAAAKRMRSEMFCYAKAAERGEDVDPGCLQTAAEKYASAFRRAEEKGGRATPSDASSVGTEVGSCVSGLVESLPPTAPSCADNKKNGSETDVDCGGSCAAKCALNQSCSSSSDCSTSSCVNGVCSEYLPSCTNGVKDGSESDVDCGGSCGRCGVDRSCSADSDCTTLYCANGNCASGCTDGVQNGAETGVDCGADCGACPDGYGCLYDADCLSSHRCVSGTCQNPCTSHVKDGNETDVDCGGGMCPGCGPGQQCKTDQDCDPSAAPCMIDIGYCQSLP
jgi:hypothetical protein